MFNFKRLLLFGGFVAVVLIFGWEVYYLIFRTLISPTPGGQAPQPGVLPNVNEAQIPTGNLNTKNISLPPITTTNKPDEIASGRATLVTDYQPTAIAETTVGPDGLVYYDEASKKFLTFNNNQSQPLSDQLFYNVDKVTWSADSQKAIIEYPDGTNIYYNFTNNSQVTLPKELEKFSVSQTGDSLAAVWESGDA